MPSVSTLSAWAAQVPPDFKFILKAPQQITHLQRLINSEESLSYLLEVAGTLEERLGGILFQLPPNMKKDLPLLQEFLLFLPRQYQISFEFREQSWFDDDVFQLLRRHNASLCIAEAESNLEVPFVSTADWGYLRLRLPDYSETALKKWVQRVQSQEWHCAYIFFKHEEEGKGPQMARRFLELLA